MTRSLSLALREPLLVQPVQMAAQHHGAARWPAARTARRQPSQLSYGSPDRSREPGPVARAAASARARSTTSAPRQLHAAATISAGASGSTGAYGAKRSPWLGTSTA